MKLYSIAPNKTLWRSVKLSYQADDKHDQSIISICPCNFEVKSSGSLVHEFCNEGSAVLMIKHSEKRAMAKGTNDDCQFNLRLWCNK